MGRGKYLDHSTASDPCNYPGTDGSRRRRKICDLSGTIQTIEDISPNDIKLVENKEVINLRGTVIPLIRLTEVLDVESTRSPEDNLIVVIVKKGDKMAGLVIDELIGQQEIVIKSLGKYIKQCKFISGATILGDGEVALILDANALL